MREKEKQPYQYVRIETIRFSSLDIITTSGEGTSTDNPVENPDGWTGEW